MATSPVMQWLAAGVPITLLCDLIDTAGFDSVAINVAEPAPWDPVFAAAARQPTRTLREQATA